MHQYLDARSSLHPIQTTNIANADLEKYYKALDAYVWLRLCASAVLVDACTGVGLRVVMGCHVCS